MRINKISLFTLLLMATVGLASCDYIHEDLSPCPTGFYLDFKYDYNLQRADMFHDHVGSVTAYLFDENGVFLFSQTESGERLRDHNYKMRLDVKPGKYQYIAIAGQRSLKEQATLPGARFRIVEPSVGGVYSDLAITLDHSSGFDNGIDTVPHKCMPLDTLWVGEAMRTVEFKANEDKVDTMSLIRDTKHINLVLRDLDKPESVDIADFDIRIYDRNSSLRWDNSVVENDTVCYTPYALWNTSDKPLNGVGVASSGRMAHADFMTSRIIYHDKANDDAVLSVKNRKSGVEVVRINLADILSRLRTSAEIDRYLPQEFLDRGYDYRLVFFLKGDRWEYVDVEISVLSWVKRIQYESFGF